MAMMTVDSVVHELKLPAKPRGSVDHGVRVPCSIGSVAMADWITGEPRSTPHTRAGTSVEVVDADGAGDKMVAGGDTVIAGTALSPRDPQAALASARPARMA